MSYKNKLFFLIILIAVLALLYSGNIIFSSGLLSRTTSFSWMDSKTAEKTTRIVINTFSGELELLKQNNQWFVSHNESIYPARQIRVQDFLNVLTARSDWPVRSSTASSHERFGLDNAASRVTVYGDNIILLDLLLGNDDYVRNETFFRLAGHNDVRSGDSSIRSYTNSPANNWYNLRLIPESEGGQLELSSVQRLTAHTPSGSQIFTRSNRGWHITGMEIENPDAHAIENYIRFILNTEGDSFSDIISWDDPAFEHSRLILEFGTGRVTTIRLTDEDESGRRFANAVGNTYVFSIPSWTAGRLFREAESFEMQ